jgi:hypothetical protein
MGRLRFLLTLLVFLPAGILLLGAAFLDYAAWGYRAEEVALREDLDSHYFGV